MNGYIKNVSPMWIHALKRAIRPGGEVTLDELYEQYGKKHGLPDGQEFVDWLRNIKLKDRDRWDIIFKSGETVVPEEVSTITKATVKKKSKTKEQTTSEVPKDTSVSTVVELSVRKAKEALPKITDLKLLQYSLKEAETRAGKDSLCRVIRSRIKQLQLAKAG